MKNTSNLKMKNLKPFGDLGHVHIYVNKMRVRMGQTNDDKYSQ